MPGSGKASVFPGFYPVSSERIDQTSLEIYSPKAVKWVTERMKRNVWKLPARINWIARIRPENAII
jgi:hypothetical protein